MPFFSSLTHTGTRVGGQREIMTQRFESGCTAFPADYPCTGAYAEVTEARGKEDKERWERKPPAKRPNWEKFGTESPWVPDWEGLLGTRKAEVQAGQETDLVPTQREIPDIEMTTEEDTTKANDAVDLTQEDDKVNEIQSWLSRGPEVPTTIESLSHSPNPSTDLLTKVNTWRAKQSLPALSIPADTLLRGALISIRLLIPCSGSPEDNAIIYKMEDEEAGKWRPLVEDGKGEFSETEVSLPHLFVFESGFG